MKKLLLSIVLLIQMSCIPEEAVLLTMDAYWATPNDDIISVHLMDVEPHWVDSYGVRRVFEVVDIDTETLTVSVYTEGGNNTRELIELSLIDNGDNNGVNILRWSSYGRTPVLLRYVRNTE